MAVQLILYTTQKLYQQRQKGHVNERTSVNPKCTYNFILRIN